METNSNHHYRAPFGKSISGPTPPITSPAPAAQDSLAFRTARDQLEIDEARTKNNLGAVVKKSLGMHSSAKFVEFIGFSLLHDVLV